MAIFKQNIFITYLNPSFVHGLIVLQLSLYPRVNLNHKKTSEVIIIMLYVYMYVVYFVMYDSVLILLLSYGHHDWFNKVFLFLFLFVVILFF